MVVLAAGKGKRFRSELPKVLHRAAGLPLVSWVLAAVEGLGADRVLVVVGHGRDAVATELAGSFPKAELVEQPEQRGTGDAVARCRGSLPGFDGDVLVLPGDAPLVTAPSLTALVEEHRRVRAAVTLLTAHLEDPTGYGRVLREADGTVRVVEEADASPAVRAIREVSTGIWCFRAAALFPALEGLRPDNAQGELYLPDTAPVIQAAGGRMITLPGADPDEVRGVNDRAQLADAARVLRRRILAALVGAGVTVEDPVTTYVDGGVEVGPDTVLRPMTLLEGSTRIGARCVVGPCTRIVDSVVGDGAAVSFSVVHSAVVGPGETVGPFVSLGPFPPGR